MIGEIASAIGKGIEYLTLLQKTASVRKLKAAVEAAESYIQVNEGAGEYKDLPPEKKEKYLKHFSKRFFRFN